MSSSGLLVAEMMMMMMICIVLLFARMDKLLYGLLSVLRVVVLRCACRYMISSRDPFGPIGRQFCVLRAPPTATSTY